ncbi:LytTR family DNA-binding domain-containing protein [Halomonas denitrificans]|nr:LytTR family transcriptional regulator [Halomonas denitrificans]
MTLDDWQRHETRNTALLWTGFFVVQTTANIAIIRADLARIALDYPLWAVLTAEISSAAVLLALIPVLLAFDRRFPIQPPNLLQHAAAHLLFTVPWSALHVAAMVALRKLVWAARGQTYEFGPLLGEFGYEYLKDVRTYSAILAIVYLYRFVIRRLRGEAKFVPEGHAPDGDPDNDTTRAPDRFLVKMLGKEFLVRVDDIDWIEAAGNYVTLHVGSKPYMLRETMASIETRLADRGFARVHRSAIVRLDRVDHIEPFDTGDARAHMTSGAQVPVSRSYRQQLKERLA